MASAKVELVRSIVAAWERGTPSPAEWAHPEIEYVIVGGPSPGTWTGLAGMAEGFRDWLGAWKDLRFDVDHYRELDDERVLVLISLPRPGKGERSGPRRDRSDVSPALPRARLQGDAVGELLGPRA